MKPTSRGDVGQVEILPTGDVFFITKGEEGITIAKAASPQCPGKRLGGLSF